MSEPTIDTFICPECQAARAGTIRTSGYHKASCPRAIGMSTGEGLNPEALEWLRALGLAPGSKLYAIMRSRSRSGDLWYVGFAIAPAAGQIRPIGREIGRALGITYNEPAAGLSLRPMRIQALVDKINGALFGPATGSPLTWQWI